MARPATGRNGAPVLSTPHAIRPELGPHPPDWREGSTPGRGLRGAGGLGRSVVFACYRGPWRVRQGSGGAAFGLAEPNAARIEIEIVAGLAVGPQDGLDQNLRLVVGEREIFRPVMAD